MRVKCIDNDSCGYGLTRLEEYNVVEQNKDYYWVIDDKGNKDFYVKHRFEIVEEKQMKVTATTNIKNGLTMDNLITKNCIYTVLREDDGYYELKNDNGEIKKYEIEYFEPLKEDKQMKKIIKDWKELDGVELDGGYVFHATLKEFIELRSELFPNIPLHYGAVSKENIIKILAVFGLDVEFPKEPKITQNDYNWLVAMKLDDNVGIKRDYKDRGIIVGLILLPFTSHLFKSLDKEYLVADLLKMKVSD
jgi:hypothetical protein